MFTTIRIQLALTMALGLAAGSARAQSYTYPQTGYPYPQGSYGQPVPYPAPVVLPQPPVRLGFQFAMCDYGMNVSALREGGLAQQIGLLPGDIIVQINEFQITDWNQYCLAVHDALSAHAGQVEMWLYRPTQAGYELQYVAFTLHEEQVIVVVPCCYHYEKCHAPHVSCWVNGLVLLNNCWKQHCHQGGKANDHCGLNINLLKQGVNLNLHKGGVNVNLGNLIQKHGQGNFGGQFGNFKTQHLKNQFEQLQGMPNFQKQIQSQFNSGFQHKFNSNHLQNFGSSNKPQFQTQGNAIKNFSSQFSRSGGGHGGGNMMRNFGGFGGKK